MARVAFVNPAEVSPPKGYTHVVSVEEQRKAIYISGQVAKNKRGETVGIGDLESQARQVYTNLLAVLKSQGASFGDVVKMNTYTTEPQNADIIRKVRSEFITADKPPASTFIGVSALADPSFLIEVEAIAVL